MDAITLSPGTTALLVVDVQDKLLPAMPTGDAQRLLRAVDLLLDAARLLKLATVVTEQYPQGLGHTAAPVLEALKGFDAPPRVIEKTEFCAVTPMEVSRALSTAGARSVIVVGMEAHVCVFQTARELHRRGYFVHVPFDAVASRDPACKTTALGLLASSGVSVTTTETAVFDLLGDAKHPHFRELSKKVRGLLG